MTMFDKGNTSSHVSNLSEGQVIRATVRFREGNPDTGKPIARGSITVFDLIGEGKFEGIDIEGMFFPTHESNFAEQKSFDNMVKIISSNFDVGFNDIKPDGFNTSELNSLKQLEGLSCCVKQEFAKQSNSTAMQLVNVYLVKGDSGYLKPVAKIKVVKEVV